MSLTKKDKEEIKRIVAEALDDIKAGQQALAEGNKAYEEEQAQFKDWEDNAIHLDCGITLAPEDYHDGARKFFTWDEAMEIEKKSNGKWRLPTPKEWMMICAELGTDEDGVFDAEVLEKNTGIKLNGWVWKGGMDDYREDPSGGSLDSQGTNGNYWSATAASTATNAYDLYFGSSYLHPQRADNKGYGFSVRCVAR